MKNLVLFILLLGLTSCYTEKKAIQQVVKAQALYPHVVASACGNFYDPLESTTDSIVYLPGKDHYRIDSVIVDCDSILRSQQTGTNYVQKSGPKYVKVPCPPCNERVDTIYRVAQRIVENKARVASLEQERDSYKAIAIKADNGRDTWRLIGLICIGVIGVAIVKKIWF